MECNRDEALRAKEIAERKFLAKDIKGAKKFALKAKNLYPELEGISQMVMTLEVHFSAEEGKINGQSNWYSVLGVSPQSDDELIRKQYRKLALTLHPDKNRSIGAEGAFQLVSQAWGLLSDKSKRVAYDNNYGANFSQKNQAPNGAPEPPPPTQNGFHNLAKNAAASQSRAPKGTSKRDSAPKSNNNPSKRDTPSGPNPSSKKDRQTFWTVCHRCKMQYEYLRMYLNRHLLCPNCHEAYFAVEIEPPSNKGTKVSSHPEKIKKHQNINNESGRKNFQWAPFSVSTGGTASAAQAANMVQQAYEKVKRERQKAQAAARKEEAIKRKNLANKRSMDAEFSGNLNSLKKRKGVEDFGTGKETSKQVKIGEKLNISVLIKDSGIKQLLMEKAREEIRDKIKARDEICDKNKFCDHQVEIKSRTPLNKLTPEEKMTVNVLDSEFHDFYKDRTVNSFRDGQIWAVYDDDDAMPRHYSKIHSVISLDPFKVNINWLNSTTLNWFRNSFSKTCGEFEMGPIEIFTSIEAFSHKIQRVKCIAETIQIFPRKGDVWALYKNWSSDWNELTDDEIIHKYEMVEVLEEYDEEGGVIVIPLVKVAGFKSIFHQHFDPIEIRKIPVEEISRFSHQVPTRLVTGLDGSKGLMGCRELDPAAVPVEILEVVLKSEGLDSVEIDEGVNFVKGSGCNEDTSAKLAQEFPKMPLEREG